MFKNYLKIAFRNLLRHKGYSALNIAGLATGMACSVLILLWVRMELSYDRFHANADRMYRITREWLNQDGTSSLQLARVAPPIGPFLKSDFPQIIEDVVRVRSDYNTLVKLGKKTFIEKRFFWAEDNFFRMFSFSLVKGDPATALKQPNCVVLTEAAAFRIFGTDDVLGMTINYENERDLKVTGIAKDVPENSHFKFDILGSFVTLNDILRGEIMTNNWGRNNYLTYVLLRPGVSPDRLREQIPDFLDRHITQLVVSQTGSPPANKPSLFNKLHVQPLTDIHLRSHLSTELEQNGDITNVYLFSIVAFFILLIACVNFMNLSTARATGRAKEIGVRKVLGAYRKQLIQQFLGESIVISCIAMVLAIVIVEAALPSFNTLTDRTLSMSVLQHPDILLLLFSVMLFVGLLAGSYPALALSSFKPIRALKGNDKGSDRSLFRTVLVVGQFTISIALIICMGIVYNQLQFLRDKKLGFTKEQVVILPMNSEMTNNFVTFKNRLMQNPGIVNVSSSSLVPSDRLINSSGAQLLSADQAEPVTFRLAVVQANYDFFSTYEIPLLAGRDFSRLHAGDDSAAFILNRAAVEKLGWRVDEAVGKPMLYGNKRGTIIGVVEDVHFESLRNPVVPMIYLIDQQSADQCVVRVQAKDIPATLSFLKSIWNSYQPDLPFDFAFLDKELESLYDEEQTLGEIFFVFSLLAVSIACLGLYGLASYAVQQRTKEIGVRKVLGASVAGLAGLLSREFLKLVLLANCIAWPIAYFAMSRWLQNFAYRVDIPLLVFLWAGFLAAAVAGLTVSYQSIRAALSNPVDALRYE